MKKPIKKNKKTKDQWNIPSNEIERENEIGSGAYGIVYKAKVIFLIFVFLAIHSKLLFSISNIIIINEKLKKN